MIFDKPPKWRWLTDRDGHRKYGAIDNAVICGHREEYVIIPSDLNFFLYSRFDIGADQDVRLIVLENGKRWTMCFSVNGDDPVPLLYWTESNKPTWV